MDNVTLDEALKNSVASAEMEGLHFTKYDIELIRLFADNKISHEELVKSVTDECRKS